MDSITKKPKHLKICVSLKLIVTHKDDNIVTI